jgi:hypothetical protein
LLVGLGESSQLLTLLFQYLTQRLCPILGWTHPPTRLFDDPCSLLAQPLPEETLNLPLHLEQLSVLPPHLLRIPPYLCGLRLCCSERLSESINLLTPLLIDLSEYADLVPRYLQLPLQHTYLLLDGLRQRLLPWGRHPRVTRWVVFFWHVKSSTVAVLGLGVIP